MINSIQHFQEKGVKNLTEIFSHDTDDLTKFAEMVYGVTKMCIRDRNRRFVLSLVSTLRRKYMWIAKRKSFRLF